MNFSFKEKGLLVSLVVTVAVFGWYFLGAFNGMQLQPDLPSLTEIIGLLILLIVFESIAQASIASIFRNEAEDERDRLITRVSYRNSYWVISAGVWLLLVQLLSSEQFDYDSVLVTPNGVFHVLLLAFVLAEITNFVTQFYYYRKGV